MTKAWDREKSKMHELYMVRNMKLSQMQEIMQKQHNFVASERAYKQKFKEWKWFKKTPRNQGVNSGAMIVARTSPNSRSYGHVGTDLRRCSDSSSLNSMDHHNGQMSPPASYADPSVSPDHSVYPTTQHGLLGLGTVHSSQPIAREYTISLPPLSELLHVKETVKQSLRTAQHLVDSEDLVAAGEHLEYGLKTLHWWNRGCR